MNKNKFIKAKELNEKIEKIDAIFDLIEPGSKINISIATKNSGMFSFDIEEHLNKDLKVKLAIMLIESHQEFDEL